MSKRDYEFIATTIYQSDLGTCADPTDSFITADRRLKLAQSLADGFQATYPSFNRFTFIHACMTGKLDYSPMREPAISLRTFDL